MRVLNDKEEKTEPSELGFFTMIAHTLFSAVGISTLLFAPLPMVVAGTRLEEPWPKIAAVAGAVLAILFFDMPPSLVILAFIFGVFVADGVAREEGLWKLVRNAGLLATVIGAVILLFSALLARTTPAAEWASLIDAVIARLREAVSAQAAVKWDDLRTALLYEGPFLYLSVAIASLWLSVGFASHMGWLSENRSYSGAGLRLSLLPMWASLAFVGLFCAATLLSVSPGQYIVGGAYRVAATLMFIQGCLCLSEMMNRRAARPRVRTLVFSLAVVVGFYAVVGMGVMGPWLLRKQRIQKNSEEVV